MLWLRHLFLVIIISLPLQAISQEDTNKDILSFSKEMQYIQTQLEQKKLNVEELNRLETQIQDLLIKIRQQQIYINQSIETLYHSIDKISLNPEQNDSTDDLQQVIDYYRDDSSKLKSLEHDGRVLEYNIAKYRKTVRYYITSPDIFYLWMNTNLFDHPIHIHPIKNILVLDSGMSIKILQFLKLLSYVFLLGAATYYILSKLQKKQVKPKAKQFMSISKFYLPFIIVLFFIQWMLEHASFVGLLTPIVVDGLVRANYLILLKYFHDISLKLFFNFSAEHEQKIIKSLNQLIFFVAFVYFINNFLIYGTLSSNVTLLFLQLFVLISSIIFFILIRNLIVLYTNTHFYPISKKNFVITLRRGLILLAFLLYALRFFGAFEGYENWVMGMSIQLIIILVYLFMSIIVYHLLILLEKQISNPISWLWKFLKKYFLLSKDKPIWEIKLLINCLFLIYISFAIPQLLLILVMPYTWVEFYEQIMHQGIHIGYMNIVPAHIFYAIVMLCLINLLGRLICKLLTSSAHIKVNRDYILFVNIILKNFFSMIAVIVFLMVLGLRPGELTIMIGALGFGLGLGMQSITFDLMSGFILFITKKIRLGDQITISGTDISGYVHKIGLLSMEIIKNNHSLATVPNSLTIKNPVLNFSNYNVLRRLIISFEVKNITQIHEIQILINHLINEFPEIDKRVDKAPIIEIIDKLHEENTEYALLLDLHLVEHANKFLFEDKFRKAVFEKAEALGYQLG